MSICGEPYPSDIGDEEWSLVVPYLLLQREDARQREHDLREVFNGLRYIVKTGAPWRWMPNDLLEQLDRDTVWRADKRHMSVTPPACSLAQVS